MGTPITRGEHSLARDGSRLATAVRVAFSAGSAFHFEGDVSPPQNPHLETVGAMSLAPTVSSTTSAVIGLHTAGRSRPPNAGSDEMSDAEHNDSRADLPPVRCGARGRLPAVARAGEPLPPNHAGA